MPNTSRITQSRPSSFATQATQTIVGASQYAVGDAISDSATAPTALPFTVGRILGGGARITGATIYKDDDDLTAAAFGLALFETAPAAAGFKDNVALAITATEWKDCIGIIRWQTTDIESLKVGSGGTVPALLGGGALHIVPDASVKTISGVLFNLETYTPSAGEIVTVTLFGTHD